MTDSYPIIDDRRSTKLTQELEYLSGIFMPQLRGVNDENGPTRALFEIAARLAGEVTQRLDKVPKRDALAFFKQLDVAQQPPVSAKVILVFVLAEKRLTPIFAPARIQISAQADTNSDTSDEIIFETVSSLNLTPAKLTYINAVDIISNRIEEPPSQFFQLEPTELMGPYKVGAFAQTKSQTLQLIPSIGLEEGDLIRVQQNNHRIKNVDNGLITLHDDDALQDSVQVNTDVYKVTQFNIFKGRNLQRHISYIGHEELLNLEQSATIDLEITPNNIATLLDNSNITAELYGVNELISKDPAWYPVEITGVVDGKLNLSKNWLGTIETVEIHGQENRWLKIETDPENTETDVFESQINSLKLQVASMRDGQDNEEVILAFPESGKGEDKKPKSIKQAFHNAIPLSLSDTFYPFGKEPILFDTFAFSAPEVLSKKGASVTLSINLSTQVLIEDLDQCEENEEPVQAVEDLAPNNPTLSWEYFNGEGWKSLELKQAKNENLNAAIITNSQIDITVPEHVATGINFNVPEDLLPTEINGHEDYWIRTRLISGDYGQAIYDIKTKDKNHTNNTTTQSVSIDKRHIYPPEIISIEASFSNTPSQSPQIILTENNRAVVNQTQSNNSTAAEFSLFQNTKAIDSNLHTEQQTDALYLGFSHSYKVNPLSLFVDATEVLDDQNQLQPVKLLFEVLGSNNQWHTVPTEDETNGLQHHGLVNLFVDISPQRSRLFGRDLFWLRVRPDEAFPNGTWASRLNGIYVNSVIAQHAKTFKQEILGSSTGEPKQTFFLSQTPVISDSLELRVRENLSEDEETELKNLQHKLQGQDSDALSEDVINIIETYPDIEGEWVLWRQVGSLVEHGGDSRVCQLDSATGAIRFGDDQFGKIPPAGADAIRAISYQSGGGEVGNVDAYTVEDLKSSVESVDQVTNPLTASGGVDALSISQLMESAPDRLRHNQQALTAVDFQALAVDWSIDVVNVFCQIPTEHNSPIRLYIAKRNGAQRCPQTNIVDRNALADYLRNRAWGGLTDRSVQVLNPDYVEIDLQVKLFAIDSKSAAQVDKTVRDQLLEFLHPINGGPDSRGWPFGRKLWKSDIFRLLSTTPQLDRVESIEFDVTLMNELSPSSLICANEESIKISVLITEEARQDG